MEFPKYDEVNAIEVSKGAYIPKDYKGVMGVPVTWLGKYNPEQFEIVGNLNAPNIDGEKIYKRILIRRKPATEEADA